MIYFVLLIFAVQAKKPDLQWYNIWSQQADSFWLQLYKRTSAWFTALFDDLNANGLGDALAGLFAPLAFLWLAATVLLQTKQLESQKEELSLTRDEMKAQRREMELQREEMNETQLLIERQINAAEAQTEATRLQADILKEQYEKSQELRKRQEFNEMIRGSNKR